MFRLLIPIIASLALLGCAGAEPPPATDITQSDLTSIAAQVENAQAIVLVVDAPVPAEAPALIPTDPNANLLDREEALKRATEDTGGERFSIPGVFTRMRVIEVLKGSADDYIYVPNTAQDLGGAETYLVFIDSMGKKTLEPMTEAGQAKLALIRESLAD